MIILVRHGQTDHNANGNLLTGHLDISLNQKGIKQAKTLSEDLKNLKFDICYCSPLLRAKQTLEKIVKYHENLNVIYDDRLKERDYGEITGKPASICQFRRWDANDLIPFKMENIPEMFDRISDFYNEILKQNNNKNILIVAHSGVARISYFYFNGKPNDNDYSDFKLENAGFLKFS